MVLLCEKTDGTLLRFILPEDFLNTYMHTLSRSRNELKLSIYFRGNYYLDILNRHATNGDANISSFLENIDVLRE